MGTLDVDGLVAGVPMDLLREWRYFYDLEPWGDDWRRTGRAVGLLGSALGAKIDPEFERRFVPTFREEGEAAEPAPERVQTEAEMIAELRKVPAFARQLEGR